MKPPDYKPKRVAYTVLGRRFVRNPLIRTCLDTWKFFPGDMPVHVFDDGTLEDIDKEYLTGEHGFHVLNMKQVHEEMEPKLKSLPTLRHYLGRIKHFTKASFTPYLARDSERCLVLDSDIYLTRPVSFPEKAPDFLFCPDDTPAFRLKPLAPYRTPLIASVNGGFIDYQPSSADLERLEYVLKTYVPNTRNNWWIEQACWSIYAGVSSSAGYFSGDDVRVVSGLGKRTPEEIRRNEFVWFKRSLPENVDEIRSQIQGASILHFAGPGTPWISEAQAMKVSADSTPHELGWMPVSPARGMQRFLLSAKLLKICGQEWMKEKVPLKRLRK